MKENTAACGKKREGLSRARELTGHVNWVLLQPHSTLAMQPWAKLYSVSLRRPIHFKLHYQRLNACLYNYKNLHYILGICVQFWRHRWFVTMWRTAKSICKGQINNWQGGYWNRRLNGICDFIILWYVNFMSFIYVHFINRQHYVCLATSSVRSAWWGKEWRL